MTTDQIREGMTPQDRARDDYQREGLGQDANPYDRELQPLQYGQYAFEMHKIWAENFRADQQLARSENNDRS